MNPRDLAVEIAFDITTARMDFLKNTDIFDDRKCVLIGAITRDAARIVRGNAHGQIIYTGAVFTISDSPVQIDGVTFSVVDAPGVAWALRVA